MAERKPKRVIPDARWVVLQDWRSHWNGVLTRVIAGPRLERSVSPGEIAVFEPTGAVVDAIEEYETTTGMKKRQVEALLYRRTGTRLVSTDLSSLRLKPEHPTPVTAHRGGPPVVQRSLAPVQDLEEAVTLVAPGEDVHLAPPQVALPVVPPVPPAAPKEQASSETEPWGEDCAACGWCATPGACVWSVVCPRCAAEPTEHCRKEGGGMDSLHVERHRAAEAARAEAAA